MESASMSTRQAPSERAASSSPGVVKRRRIRVTKRELTDVDKRSIMWKRIVELRKVFTDAILSAGLDMSPVRAMRLETAAQSVALAEVARGKFLRGETVDLSAVISAERRGDMAMKRLGLNDAPRPADRDSGAELRAHLAKYDEGYSPAAAAAEASHAAAKARHGVSGTDEEGGDG
jgi:hypothetical protein